MQNNIPIKLGRYKHYKGQDYIVIGEATNTETMELMVIYIQDYSDYKPAVDSHPIVPHMWARPKVMFLGPVAVEGKTVNRFEYIGPWCCSHCNNPCNGLGG